MKYIYIGTIYDDTISKSTMFMCDLSGRLAYMCRYLSHTMFREDECSSVPGPCPTHRGRASYRTTTLIPSVAVTSMHLGCGLLMRRNGKAETPSAADSDAQKATRTNRLLRMKGLRVSVQSWRGEVRHVTSSSPLLHVSTHAFLCGSCSSASRAQRRSPCQNKGIEAFACTPVVLLRSLPCHVILLHVARLRGGLRHWLKAQSLSYY